MSLQQPPRAGKRTKLFTALGVSIVVALIAVGIFAKNGWFPSTDPFTGKKTGWFGRQLPRNASSSWNPFAAPLPTPTPQLSKEYIYAGSRLLAVEDANANAILPADVAIWRPSTGTWWVMGGAGGSQALTQAWGTCPSGPTCDKPVPGDYDGDGKTDLAVYRPPSQEWYILRSSDNAWAPVISWGLSTDKRVPADYDGDGKSDHAVWRDSDGKWYIVRSSDGGTSILPFGSSGDLPAQADYDGDGRVDIGVWRNSDQKFYSVSSSTNSLLVISIGQTGSEAVSADYDGDGKADHAIRDGANWIIRYSSSGSSTSIPWEQSTDIAVPNDYDGDGKCDIATWRDSNGNWYIRQSASTNSLRQVGWGVSGDIPVPALYRR